MYWFINITLAYLHPNNSFHDSHTHPYIPSRPKWNQETF